MAECSKPIRDLLNKDTQFYWGQTQQESFDKIKQILIKAPVLAFYDPQKETVLMTDASKQAIGNVLLQKQDDGQLKPVSYASRALTPTESRYAAIELESLGVTWSCEKHRNLLIGKPFHIVTDHKPLISLLGKKGLNDLPLRIQCFRLHLMEFSYTISHESGKNLFIPDYLSRHLTVDSVTCQDKQLCEDIELSVNAIISNLPATDQRLEEIKQKQASDYVC